MEAIALSDDDARLRALLRTELPPAVAALSEPDRAALADLLEESRRRQSASLQASFDTALRHVPFPVRGLVKKVLLG